MWSVNLKKINLVFLLFFLSLLLLGDIRDITAEEVIWNQSESKITFRGNVEMREEKFQLFTPRMVAYMKEGKFKKIEGEDGVRIIREKEKIRADTFLYVLKDRKLLLGGKVVIERNEVNLEGESAVFDLGKDQVILKGKIKMFWKNASGNKSSEKDR